MFILKRTKSKNLIIFTLIFVFCISITSPSLTVCAANGWWIDSEETGASIYNAERENVSFDEIDWSELSVNRVNAFEAILGDIVYYIGVGLDWLLGFAGDLKLSIDNIVLGRLAPDSSNISFMQFGLETGNPWGILGARIYVAVRSVIYGAFLVVILAQLIWQLVKGGGGAVRAETKALIQSAIFYFIMIYMFPYIYQAVLYVRDVFMYVILNKEGGEIGVTGGLLFVFEKMFLTQKSVLNALIYLATVFAGLWFLGNYVGNALIQTGLFGSAPYIFLRSVKNKRLFQQWFNTISINSTIPLLDAVFILIPGIIGKILHESAGIGEYNITFMLLRLFLIWSVIPARNAILLKISEGAGGGLITPGGGLGALGALAIRAAMRGGKGLSEGGIGGRGGGIRDSLPDDDLKEAQSLMDSGQSIREAERNLGRQMPDIEQLFGTGGQQTSFEELAADDGALASICGAMPDDGMNGGADFATPELGNGIGAFNAEGIRAEGMDEYRGDSSGISSYGASETTGIPGVTDDVDTIMKGSMDSESLSTSLSDIDGANNNSINTIMTEANEAETGQKVSVFGNDMQGAETTTSNALYGRMGTDELSKDVTDRDETAQARYDNLRTMESCQSRMDGNDKRIQNLSLEEQAVDQQIVQGKNDCMKEKQLAGMEYAEAQRKVNEASSIIAKHQSGEQILAKGDYAQVSAQYTENYDKMRGAKQRMQMADARMKDYDTRVTPYADRNGAAPQSEAYRLNQRKMELQQQRQSLETKNADLRRAQAKCVEIENKYSAFDKAKGGSGQKFSSSQVYKQTVESNARKAKLANVLNFDTSKFNGVLTAEERAGLLRERALNGQRAADRARIIRSAQNVAKTAGMAVGAIGAMYGGASNMVYAGMAGGMAGEKIVTAPKAAYNFSKATVETVEAIDRERSQIGQNAKVYHDNGVQHSSNTPNYKREENVGTHKSVPYNQTEEALLAKEHVRNNMGDMPHNQMTQ